jgi:NADPH-dependent 2,4-dienoyl-CoA reductase/sulfur reductase-like enzyme
MPEPIALSADGKEIRSTSGVTVAAALSNASVGVCRESVTGEGRGVLCAMGICFECRVTIDGVRQRRACIETVREGMRVETGRSREPVPGGRTPDNHFALECEVVVVGAGPAGVAAACRAAESGARTVVLDEGLAPGGQIYRHRAGSEPPPPARMWIDRLARSGAPVHHGASVFDARRDGELFRLDAETASGSCTIRARRVILATGARELFLPFPGWTLPGVMGAGGAQALWKSGASLSGRTALVGGSGPLLLPVAASLAKAGAKVKLVAEQAGLRAVARFAAGLAGSSSKMFEAARHRAAFRATPYRTGTWIAEAKGTGQVEAVVLTNGRRSREIECDLAALAYGLVPNTELARLLGCEMRGGAVAVNLDQRSSVPGVFCAGEPCGVAGVDVAIAEGQIAGLASVGRVDGVNLDLRDLAAIRRKGRRLAARMDRCFAPRPELRALARPDTIVCRCEDTTLASLSACGSAREAKLSARAGMGPCQGRVCGPALAFLFGWDSDTVRPPARPALLGNLAASE